MPPQDEEVKTDVAPVESTDEQATPPATPESDVAPAPLVEKGPFAIIVTWVEGADPEEMQKASKDIADQLEAINSDETLVSPAIKSLLISRI